MHRDTMLVTIESPVLFFPSPHSIDCLVECHQSVNVRNGFRLWCLRWFDDVIFVVTWREIFLLFWYFLLFWHILRRKHNRNKKSPKNMNQTVIIVIMNVLCHRFFTWCWYFKDTLCKFTPSKHNDEFWTDWNRVTLHQISLINCAANYTIFGYELKKNMSIQL